MKLYKKCLQVVSLLLSFALLYPVYPSTASAADGQVIPDGIYNISLKQNDMCLSPFGSTGANGTAVIINPRDGNNFRVKYIGEGKYKLYAMCSNNGNGRVVDVYRGNSTTAPLKTGLNIDLWDDNDPPAQEFYIKQQWDGFYSIELAALPGNVLTCKDCYNPEPISRRVTLETYENSTHQHWSFTQVQEQSYNGELVSSWLDNITTNIYPDGTHLGPNYSYNNAYQCFGFGIEVFHRMFGSGRWYYNGTPNGNCHIVAQLHRGEYTESNVLAFINQANPGDIIQFDVPNQHTMVYCWRSPEGFGVYDANYFGDNVVHNHMYKFSSWVNQNSNTITLLRADNYPMK